ncbi:hypothetical protein F8M41_007242 [Gigaspora margarita]|uniref:Uncharacterized protein n=1 Tax=Gigaspora margarita TaxID=4874 RepID=A0A8H3X575_GIGMA|nr:hypothetical protein F8M41_007242 [Gigaspora margarita]
MSWLESDSVLWQQPFADGLKKQEQPEIGNVTANNLSKKAIQLGLDTGSVAIQGLNTFMDKFIKKHSLKCTIDQVLKPKHSKKMKPPIESSSSDLNMDDSCDSSDESYSDNNVEI